MSEYVPCLVRDLSDEDAYMQLVLCNTQSELSELEQGLHALNSGLTVRDYAEKTKFGKSRVHQTMMAADVSLSTHVDKVSIQKDWRNLAEIHAAESGMDLKAYAEAAGKVRTTLSDKVKAWRVMSVTHVRHEEVDERALFNEWRHNQVDNPHGAGEFEDYLQECRHVSTFLLTVSATHGVTFQKSTPQNLEWI